MLQQAFIFITKIIFASGWIDPEVFEERQKYADKEVKITRSRSVQGGMRFGRKNDA